MVNTKPFSYGEPPSSELMQWLKGSFKPCPVKKPDLSNSESVVLDPITQADAIGHTESDPQTNKWRQCQTDRVSVRYGSFKC